MKFLDPQNSASSEPLRVWTRVAAVVGLTLALSPALAARGFQPAEVERSYHQVLQLLAQDREAEALSQLTELERSAVGEAQAWRYIDNLWRTKLKVIRELLEGQPLVLLRPIIVLHHDAYFAYAEEGRRHLAHHSRTMASELADLYAEREATPQAQAFAGWTLISFGAYLWSPSDIRESADFFFRAKQHDPSNLVALEGLSVSYERGGNYELALETLHLARRRAPDDPELALRLALCNLRLEKGDHQRALELLGALTDPQHPRWIRSIAYQQLARVRMDAGQIDETENLLERGLTALPGDEQLSIELAALLDGQHRRAEALGVLDRMEIGRWQDDSPRLIYDFWRPPGLDTIRARLHEESLGGRAALAASLARETAP